MDDRILVTYASAVDGSPCEEVIHHQDVAQVVLERGVYDGRVTLHRSLQHRDGWTCHFNDGFRGAAEVSARLQQLLGFQVPPADTIGGAGGRGTIVWSV